MYLEKYTKYSGKLSLFGGSESSNWTCKKCSTENMGNISMCKECSESKEPESFGFGNIPPLSSASGFQPPPPLIGLKRSVHHIAYNNARKLAGEQGYDHSPTYKTSPSVLPHEEEAEAKWEEEYKKSLAAAPAPPPVVSGKESKKYEKSPALGALSARAEIPDLDLEEEPKKEEPKKEEPKKEEKKKEDMCVIV